MKHFIGGLGLLVGLLLGGCASETSAEEDVGMTDDAVRTTSAGKLATSLGLGAPVDNVWRRSLGDINVGYEEMGYAKMVGGKRLVSKIFRVIPGVAKGLEEQTQVSHVDVALPTGSVTLDGAAVDAAFSFSLGALRSVTKTATKNETVLIFSNGRIVANSEGKIYPVPTPAKDIVPGSMRTGFGDIQYIRRPNGDFIDDVVIHLARPHRTKLGQLKTAEGIEERHPEDRKYTFEGGTITKIKFGDFAYSYELQAGVDKKSCTLIDEVPPTLECSK
ncbi:MAG: hypothetical protein KBF88_00760 [Polyangiaceae bacterium]|nr:hypothetical protein [Polyangiaceae bacterium]